jgi:hypothetical protein
MRLLMLFSLAEQNEQTTLYLNFAPLSCLYGSVLSGGTIVKFVNITNLFTNTKEYNKKNTTINKRIVVHFTGYPN